MRYVLPILAATLVQTGHVHAETRQMDSHEHGSGTLNIALEGSTVVMEFEAPGYDIVGFEYEATSDKDLAAIEAAIEKLESPMSLFVPNNSAGCTVAASHASLMTEEDGHEEHKDHEHDDDHEEHAEGEDHDEDHADDHDKHDHEHDDDHDEHAKDEDHDEDHADDHDEHDHEDEASHTEFEAEYALTCDSPEKLTSLAFTYFQTFPNAEELDIQLITEKGAFAFEADRANPTVDLQGTQ